MRFQADRRHSAHTVCKARRAYIRAALKKSVLLCFLKIQKIAPVTSDSCRNASVLVIVIALA